MELKKLDDTYDKTRSFVSGFTYHLVKRQGNYAIYEQRSTEHDHSFYEVIEVKVVKMRESDDFGRGLTEKYSHREIYPSTTNWGKTGWSYRHLKNAQARFNKLINN